MAYNFFALAPWCALTHTHKHNPTHTEKPDQDQSALDENGELVHLFALRAKRMLWCHGPCI